MNSIEDIRESFQKLEQMYTDQFKHLIAHPDTVKDILNSIPREQWGIITTPPNLELFGIKIIQDPAVPEGKVILAKNIVEPVRPLDVLRELKIEFQEPGPNVDEIVDAYAEEIQMNIRNVLAEGMFGRRNSWVVYEEIGLSMINMSSVNHIEINFSIDLSDKKPINELSKTIMDWEERWHSK